jgi:hypothetical protein
MLCPSRAKCESADCCFSVLALQKSNLSCCSSTKRTSSSSSPVATTYTFYTEHDKNICYFG